MRHLITFTSNISQIRADLKQSIDLVLSEPDVEQKITDKAFAGFICGQALDFFTETTLFGDLGHYVDCKIVEGVMYTTFELRALPGEGVECLTRRKRPVFEEALAANLETAMYSALADNGITFTDE